MAQYKSHEERSKLAYYDKGPGPAGYSLPVLIGKRNHAVTHRINPEYTIGLKLRSAFGYNGIGPGPAYFIERGLKANGKFLGYQYTIRRKYPLLDKNLQYPGPNRYKIPPADKYKRRAPAFLLSSRTPIYNKNVTPSPSKYLLPSAIGPKIPDKLAAAECTLKGDRKERIAFMMPAPSYNIGKVELIKPRAPAFTMRIKWIDQSGQKYPVGPASYLRTLPTCPCKVPKGCHLGIRYNDFTGIFRTQCDKAGFDSLD